MCNDTITKLTDFIAIASGQQMAVVAKQGKAEDRLQDKWAHCRLPEVAHDLRQQDNMFRLNMPPLINTVTLDC